MDMAAVGRQLREQDNRGTSHPIFVIQQRNRVYGIADDHTEWVTWTDMEGHEIPSDLSRSLEVAYGAGIPAPEGFRRIGYIDLWDFVTACLTEQGAEDYIAANGHNLKDPRIYVTSGYRNYEWIALREMFLSHYDTRQLPDGTSEDQPPPEASGDSIEKS